MASRIAWCLPSGASLFALLTCLCSALAQNAPVFEYSEYHRQIREDSVVGTSVVTMTANDADVGDRVTYFIDRVESNNYVPGSRLFFVQEFSGLVTTTALFDAEDDRFFHVFVRAQDDSPSRMSSTVQLTVILEDTDDSPPSIKVLDPQVVFADGRKPNIDNGFPVDVARTVKVQDEDSDLFGLRYLSAALRSTTGVSELLSLCF